MICLWIGTECWSSSRSGFTVQKLVLQHYLMKRIKLNQSCVQTLWTQACRVNRWRVLPLYAAENVHLLLLKFSLFLTWSLVVFQPAVCHVENRQRQAVEGLYRYIFCHESALRTQGVHPYQVSYLSSCRPNAVNLKWTTRPPLTWATSSDIWPVHDSQKVMSVSYCIYLYFVSLK